MTEQLSTVIENMRVDISYYDMGGGKIRVEARLHSPGPAKIYHLIKGTSILDDPEEFKKEIAEYALRRYKSGGGVFSFG